MSGKARRITAVGALTVGVLAATALPASAWEQDAGASIDFVSIAVHGGEADLTVTYTCNSPEGTGTHLFAAVKQGGGINTDARSTSQFARAFYSTNWSSDAGPNQITCDGGTHTQTLVLVQDAYWARHQTNPKDLKTGAAFVQLCLFANMVGDPESGGTSDLSFDYSMQNIASVS